LVENKAQNVGFGRGFWTATAVLAVLSIAAIVFWSTFPLETYLPAAIVTARQVDHLFRFMAATGSALWIFVAGYLVYFAIAFRVKPDDPPDAIGLQVHDNHKLEFWWTVIPTLFVVLLSIVSVRIWYEVMLEPQNGLVVEAIGHQFYFSFRYPQINGEVTDEMHLPVNVPVTLNLTAADVIHGFWVPAMRLKNDTVPGLVTTTKSRYSIGGSSLGQSRTRTSATRCPRQAVARSPFREATHRPVRRSSPKSARPATSWRPSIKRSSAPGSRTFSTIPRTRTWSTVSRRRPRTWP
jgi:heme/copper-type cytochrome/quinol oxidase subunit 2